VWQWAECPSDFKVHHSANTSHHVLFNFILGSTVKASHGAGCMPPRRVPISPDIKKLVQEAYTQLCAQAKPNISDVIHKIKARTGVALPYHTVCNHFQGKHILLSSNIVNTHPFFYTSLAHPSLHPPSSFPPLNLMHSLSYHHHPISNVISFGSYTYNPYLMQN